MKTLTNILCVVLVFHTYSWAEDTPPIRASVFEVEVTPPIGSILAYDPVRGVQTPLQCKGVVIIGNAQPIVLCAVDWIGIGNASHQIFREQVAAAAGTSPDRVAVHTLHQHDAPWCDFSIEAVLVQYGVPYRPFDSKFAREAIAKVASAVSESLERLQTVTHVGAGQGTVDQVASNRRILGPDGKVLHVRWSASKDPIVREFPEGLIDPKLRMVSLWNGDKPIVALSYYATHPQSYYRTGLACADFPGIARETVQAKTGVPLIHFNGAGGNITAGKYNDGAAENRQVLADRMAVAMEKAWAETKRKPISGTELTWETQPVALPLPLWVDKPESEAILADPKAAAMQRFNAATKLVWLTRSQANEPLLLGCLGLGDTRILHLPGELFVEYQLASQSLRPDLNVCMAAYGDYGPAYIGTAISYSQGGYETGPNTSMVAPGSETVLMKAIAKLLKCDESKIAPLP